MIDENVLDTIQQMSHDELLDLKERVIVLIHDWEEEFAVRNQEFYEPVDKETEE